METVIRAVFIMQNMLKKLEKFNISLVHVKKGGKI